MVVGYHHLRKHLTGEHRQIFRFRTVRTSCGFDVGNVLGTIKVVSPGKPPHGVAHQGVKYLHYSVWLFIVVPEATLPERLKNLTQQVEKHMDGQPQKTKKMFCQEFPMTSLLEVF